MHITLSNESLKTKYKDGLNGWRATNDAQKKKNRELLFYFFVFAILFLLHRAHYKEYVSRIVLLFQFTTWLQL